MAHSLSAKKRIRQNDTRRMRNRMRISELKTEIKKYLVMIHDRQAEDAKAQLRKVHKMLDQIASKGTIHPNRAARTKGRLTKRLNALADHAAAG